MSFQGLNYILSSNSFLGIRSILGGKTRQNVSALKSENFYLWYWSTLTSERRVKIYLVPNSQNESRRLCSVYKS